MLESPYTISCNQLLQAGDNNNAIYITKKIAMAQAATAIQVIFDAVVMSGAN